MFLKGRQNLGGLPVVVVVVFFFYRLLRLFSAAKQLSGCTDETTSLVVHKMNKLDFRVETVAIQLLCKVETIGD